jgi:hypothetical protein
MGTTLRRIYVDVPADAANFDALFDAVCQVEQNWATEDRRWDPMVYSHIVNDDADEIVKILGDASEGTVAPERAKGIARRALAEACDNREGK